MASQIFIVLSVICFNSRRVGCFAPCITMFRKERISNKDCISMGDKNCLRLFGLKTFLGFAFDLKDRIPECISNYISYIGRNSLAIVLFSPLFTVTAKLCAPFFAFDDTRILGTICCLSMITALCLFFAMLFDKLTLSRIIGGKNIYSKL